MTNRPTRKSDPNPWATALRMLNRRDYGVSELAKRLNERGFSEDQVKAVLKRCVELDYLDDARYASARARSLMRQGRAVGRCILADLRQRGIDEETACLALEDARGELSDQSVLTALLERRFPEFDFSAAAVKERRRVIHFLQRRGFPLDLIMQELM